MNAKRFAEVNLNTIQRLKKQGFTSVQLVLLDKQNPYRATVEFIPVDNQESGMDMISLYSNEILDYVNVYPQMAEYIVDQKYLTS